MKRKAYDVVENKEDHFTLLLKDAQKSTDFKEALKKIGEDKGNNTIQWFEEKGLKLEGNDVEKAYKLLYEYLKEVTPDWKDDQMQIIEKTPIKITYRFYGSCPWLDACNKLGLDTKDVCPSVSGIAWTKVFSIINPKLKLVKNHIQPHYPYCEESIELERT